MIPKIKKVDITSNYYRIRFRDPRIAKTCRVPAWATRTAITVSKGAKVITCKSKICWQMVYSKHHD